MEAGECASYANYQLKESWEEQQQQGNNCPVDGTTGKAQPARHEQEQKKRIHERTTEVVKYLPTRDIGNGICHPFP